MANPFNKGTYDVSTKTYTSPSGQKQSMSVSDAQKTGANIVFSSSGSSSKKSSGGGGSSGGGSSGGGSSAPSQKVSSVQINGNSVVIDGVGYSVKPSDQASFIQQKTGGYGSSAQNAIQQATQRAIQLQQQQAAAQRQKAAEEFQRKYIVETKLKNLQILSPANKRQSISEADFNRQVKIYEDQFKKNPIRERSFKDLINSIGATTKSRKTQLAISQLNQERDRIYSDLNRINNLFPSQLTEDQYYQYQKMIAPIVARYNVYNEAKQTILKTLPAKQTQASIEYNPGLGKDVLVLNQKDLSLSNKISEAINKTITKLQRGQATAKNTAILSGLVAAGATVSAVRGFAQLPSSIITVLRNPSVIKQIPSQLKQAGIAEGKLLKVSPTAGLVKLGTEYYLWVRAPGDAIKIVRKIGAQSTRLSPLFRGVEESSLGVKSIKRVNKVGDIEIILNRGERLRTKPLKVIEEAQLEEKLRKTPSLPSATRIEKKILKVVKKRGDIVAGSYAREALLKRKFVTAHKDLDIASSNIPALQRALKNEFGRNVKFVRKPNSIMVKVNGRSVADIVPLSRAEGGLIRKFGVKRVNGLKLANPKALLGGKVEALGKATTASRTRGKTIRDIGKLTGKKALNRPALKGAYGFTKKEMKQYLGKSGTLTTAQADLLVKGLLKRNPMLKNERWLYATPWEVATGRAQVRVSRLGLKSEEASIMELLRGQVSFFRSGKPQIFVLPKEKIFKAAGKLSKARTIRTPEGFVIPNFSSELEVVLGKGYILKRGRILGRTIIGGESVPIVELQKIRLSKALRDELKTYNKLQRKLESLVKKERKLKTPSLKKQAALERNKLVRMIDDKERSLNVKLKKKTGFDYFSSPTQVRKYYPIGKRSLSAASKISRIKISKKRSPVPKRKVSRKRASPKKSSASPRKRTTSKRGSSRSRPSRTTSSAPVSRRSPIKRSPSKTPGRSYPRSPGRTRPKTPPARKKSAGQEKFKTLSKPGRIFSIIVKKRGRAVVLKVKGIVGDRLLERDALNFMAFELDTQLLRTARLKPTGTSKKVRKLPAKYNGAFEARKRKLRAYKIQKKKKVAIRGFIEKKRFALDTPTERAQLRRAKKKTVRIKRKVSKPIKRKKIVRRTARPVKKKAVKRKVTRRKPIRKKAVKKKAARKKRTIRKKK